MIHRGELYWIPAEALRPGVPGEPHPYLVVQEDVLNHSRLPTLVVMGLSSQLRRATEPGNVVLEEGEGDLPRQSVVIVSQVCVVDKAALGARIGQLNAARVAQALGGLGFQQRSGRR